MCLCVFVKYSHMFWTLCPQDYSWEDHGFPFLTRVYPDLGPLLEDKFKEASRMTYRR